MHWIRRHFALIALPLWGLAIAAGGFGQSNRAVGPVATGVLAVATAVHLLRRLAARVPHVLAPFAVARYGVWDELAFGLLITLCAHAIVDWTGGLTSAAYPVAYGLVGFLGATHQPALAAVFTLGAIGLDWARFAAAGATDLATPIGHSVFFGLFGSMYQVLLRADMALNRREAGLDYRRRLETLRSEVKALRQRRFSDWRISKPGAAPAAETPGGGPSGGSGTAEADEHLAAATVIHEHIFDAMSTIDAVFTPYSAVMLTRDPVTGDMHIAEAVSRSETLREGRIAGGEGFLGAVVKRGATLCLNAVRPEIHNLNYYSALEPIRHVLATTVRDGGDVIGVLLVDRTEERPFTPEDEGVIQGMAAVIRHLIAQERLLWDLEEQRGDIRKIFHFSSALNDALSPAEVYEAFLQGVAAAVPADFAAIALASEDGREQRIVKVLGRGAEQLEGLVFSDQTGLAAQVLRKPEEPLPATDFAGMDARYCVVFDDSVKLTNLKSLKVFPLRLRSRAIGTLTVGSRKVAALPPKAVHLLSNMAANAAVSIDNALAYQRMEMMATTDGLTGLTNHRRFQEALDEALARASRGKDQVAIMLTDIDHFKKINDTYGHPTGDVVIKEVAKLLRRIAREVDICARYGGEEFAVIMENTGYDGAATYAERARKEIERLGFASGQATFKATISVGLAVFPGDAAGKKALIALADKALYASKQGGRNRVTLAKDLKGQAP